MKQLELNLTMNECINIYKYISTKGYNINYLIDFMLSYEILLTHIN